MKRVLSGVLLALTLSACDPHGLDLSTPSDAKRWVWACARGQGDVYCAALLPTVQAVSGPVTVLHPNEGDTDITARLAAVLERRGLTLTAFRASPNLQAEFARANTFALPGLTSGQHATLDGQVRTVTCADDHGTPSCALGNIRGWDHLRGVRDATGAVYATWNAAPDGLPFLLPGGW